MLSIVIHSVGTVSYRSALKRVPLVPSPSGGRQHYFLPSLLSLSLSLSPFSVPESLSHLELGDPALLLPVEQGVHHLRLAQRARVSSLPDFADTRGTEVVPTAARQVRLPHQQQTYRTF